jgi:hypothetical protein
VPEAIPEAAGHCSVRGNAEGISPNGSAMRSAGFQGNSLSACRNVCLM